MKSGTKPVLFTTYHQVEQTCDAIFALTANPIFRKLYFHVILHLLFGEAPWLKLRNKYPVLTAVEKW